MEGCGVEGVERRRGGLELELGVGELERGERI